MSRLCPCGCGAELRDEPARLRQEYASPACRERVRRHGPMGRPAPEQLSMAHRSLAGMQRQLGRHNEAERLDRMAEQLG